MPPNTLSRFFLTVSGLCTALGGLQAFQLLGSSTPLAHKVTVIIMGVGVVAAYLANSPLVNPTTAARQAAAMKAFNEDKKAIALKQEAAYAAVPAPLPTTKQEATYSAPGPTKQASADKTTVKLP